LAASTGEVEGKEGRHHNNPKNRNNDLKNDILTAVFITSNYE